MLQVAICDDSPEIRATLRDDLNRFSAESGIDLTVAQFDCGEALLAHGTDGVDLLILDIQMSGLDGLETARRIRATNQNLTIIFFTNYIQYALEGYEVQAYRFLLKPLTYEQFSDVVGKTLTELHARRKAVLVVRTKAQTRQLPIDALQYVETYKGHVLLHTPTETIESFTTMKELEETLKAHKFLRCHTAFLVSMREIKSITQQDVVLRNGQLIPLSKHRKKAVREVVTVYWGEQFL